jgi:hypothetical protein
MGNTWRAFTILIFSVFAIAIVVFAVNVGSKSGPPVAFILFFSFAALWNAYWFLFRMAYEVSFDDHDLQWRAPLRSGTLPLLELTVIRPQKLSPNVYLFESTGRRPVLMMLARGSLDLIRDVNVAAPQVTVKIGRTATLWGRGGRFKWGGYRRLS